TDVLRTEGFESVTLQSLLLSKPLLSDRRLVVLDEAGAVGIDDMKRLFDLAPDARLVLSGDTGQHASVVRGDALRILEQHPDWKSECCSRIRSASPRTTDACWPVSPERTRRASRARSNSRFMSSIPTAPASSSTTSRRSDSSGFDSNKLCNVTASNPSLRRTSVAAAVGAQNSGSIFISAQAATNSRSAVVLPVPARPRSPVMRSPVRRTW